MDTWNKLRQKINFNDAFQEFETQPPDTGATHNDQETINR